jgi:hypothetical protein
MYKDWMVWIFMQTSFRRGVVHVEMCPNIISREITFRKKQVTTSPDPL